MSDQELIKMASRIRTLTIKAIYTARSGHLGGSLSIADILSVLYFHWLEINPADPGAVDQDRVVLSKGHAAPALYAALALRGYFPPENLLTLRAFGGKLPGHPDMRTTPGVDFSTGSLGQGLSAGLGMALALRLAGIQRYAVVILGDGELNEGQVWETASLAAQYQAGNLLAIVDCNGLQQDGKVSTSFTIGSLEQKWLANGWITRVIDGHDITSIRLALPEKLPGLANRPLVVLARTTKGKGLAIAESDNRYHSDLPDLNAVGVALARMEGSYD
jgi:transketolase